MRFLKLCCIAVLSFNLVQCANVDRRDDDSPDEGEFKPIRKVTEGPNGPKPLRIAVGTFYTKGIASYADIASKIDHMYTKKHGYQLIVSNEVLIDFQKMPHYTWNKFPFVAKHIKDYDYFMWIDADATFRNFEVKIEDFIDQNAEIVVAHDMWQTHENNINAGVIIFKGGEWNHDLLTHMMTDPDCEKFYAKPFHDQSCIEEMYKKDYNGIRSKMKIIPYQKFQGPYDASFIYHMAGSKQGIVENFSAILKEKTAKYPALAQ